MVELNSQTVCISDPTDRRVFPSRKDINLKQLRTERISGHCRIMF